MNLYKVVFRLKGVKSTYLYSAYNIMEALTKFYSDNGFIDVIKIEKTGKV